MDSSLEQATKDFQKINRFDGAYERLYEQADFDLKRMIGFLDTKDWFNFRKMLTVTDDKKLSNDISAALMEGTLPVVYFEEETQDSDDEIMIKWLTILYNALLYEFLIVPDSITDCAVSCIINGPFPLVHIEEDEKLYFARDTCFKFNVERDPNNIRFKDFSMGEGPCKYMLRKGVRRCLAAIRAGSDMERFFSVRDISFDEVLKEKWCGLLSSLYMAGTFKNVEDIASFDFRTNVCEMISGNGYVSPSKIC